MREIRFGCAHSCGQVFERLYLPQVWVCTSSPQCNQCTEQEMVCRSTDLGRVLSRGSILCKVPRRTKQVKKTATRQTGLDVIPQTLRVVVTKLTSRICWSGELNYQRGKACPSNKVLLGTYLWCIEWSKDVGPAGAPFGDTILITSNRLQSQGTARCPLIQFSFQVFSKVFSVLYLTFQE